MRPARCALGVVQAPVSAARVRCLRELRWLLRVRALGRCRRRGDGLRRGTWFGRGRGCAPDRRVPRCGGLGITRIAEQILPHALIEPERLLLADLQRRRVQASGRALELLRALTLAHVDYRMRDTSLVEQSLRGIADDAAGKRV